MPSLDLTVDASSVINLINSGRANASLRGLPSVARVTPEVKRETDANSDTGNATQILMGDGLLESEPEIVSFAELEGLIFASSLGAGECETILSCSKTGRTVCCDDKKARKLAIEMLGDEKLTGSIGLLKHKVTEGTLTADEALEAVQQMVHRGAFLPQVNVETFNA
jgi:predicted nucleic acid-binding protein